MGGLVVPWFAVERVAFSKMCGIGTPRHATGTKSRDRKERPFSTTPIRCNHKITQPLLLLCHTFSASSYSWVLTKYDYGYCRTLIVPNTLL
jgi:hypothetical protein